ncbi:hypothetical protein JVU11DRAFT_11883 [Chiua virens]|nr:hypothetical protein JVU11DRAFT_11883 [Chiua virens]
MDFVQQLILLERGERDDHEAALALERGKPLPPPTPAQLAMQKMSFAEAL